MLYEAAIPFRVGPLHVVLADPRVPLEPLRVVVGPPEREEHGEPIATGPSPEELREQAAREEREQLENLLNHVADAVRDLRLAQRDRLGEMQQVAVELAVAVATHVLYERIESGDYAIEELVRSAVKRLEPGSAVTVSLHPDDLALLERRQAEGTTAILTAEEMRLVADASMGRGDCRAETGDVALMSNLEEHLKDIRRDLLNGLPEAQVERRKNVAEERNLRRYPDRRVARAEAV